jgi:GxxExxY protein
MEELKEAAEEVHEHLGAGFTETVYHSALSQELSAAGIEHQTETPIPVMYKGTPVGRRRPDMMIVTEYGLVVVELKASSSSGSAQLSQYLGMTTANKNLGEIIGGAVIRFNEEVEYEYTAIKDGEMDTE